MRRTVFLLIFLLTSCAPDQAPVSPSLDPLPSTTAPALPSSVSTVPSPEATVATATALPPPSADCSRGDYVEEVESGGQARQYILHVPATYNPEEPGALVLVFHGAGISAERFVDYSRFSTVADREGFLVVYPQGQGPKEEAYWDTSPGSRDVQFIRDLIDHLQRRCPIDPKRVYASGHSNGGGMVNRLACELADRLAAVGTISGAYSSSSCSPARPIAVFAIHGKADTIVSYSGIPEWASAWAERNGCSAEPEEIPHNVLIHERRWSQCREGAEVILYSIEDLGHDWTHDLINFGQTIWDFFEAHSLERAP